MILHNHFNCQLHAYFNEIVHAFSILSRALFYRGWAVLIFNRPIDVKKKKIQQHIVTSMGKWRYYIWTSCTLCMTVFLQKEEPNRYQRSGIKIIISLSELKNNPSVSRLLENRAQFLFPTKSRDSGGYSSTNSSYAVMIS